LGGFFPAHVEHLGAVCTAAWMPLAWLSVIELRDSVRWLPVLALALAMSVLAGYTPLTALVFASTLLAGDSDGASSGRPGRACRGSHWPAACGPRSPP